MNLQGWLDRLTKQLPGWHVWYQSAGGVTGRGWYAVPAPGEAAHLEALELPHRLGPYDSPQDLRDDAEPRYGWYDVCDTCNTLARECGHRQPEREKGDGVELPQS